MQFAIHFTNFAEHFFLNFVKFVNQSLITKLSFNFKHNTGQVRDKVTLILVKNTIYYICFITVTFSGVNLWVISSASASSVITSNVDAIG